MLPKYELTAEWRTVSGNRVFVIRALRDFGTVKEGELGGWLESEQNLSHEGDCWVGENAVVSGAAVVSGNAQVSGTAWILRNAHVSEEAHVVGDALVTENARVGGSACVSGNARVGGSACVSGNARVYGRAQVFSGTWTTSPTQIQGSWHFVTHSCPGHITIGCQTRPIAHWLSEYRHIGKEFDYTEEQIEEYFGYIQRIAAIEEEERSRHASKVYAD